jgi:hypothetical protein
VQYLAPLWQSSQLHIVGRGRALPCPVHDLRAVRNGHVRPEHPDACPPPVTTPAASNAIIHSSRSAAYKTLPR